MGQPGIQTCDQRGASLVKAKHINHSASDALPFKGELGRNIIAQDMLSVGG